MVEAAVQQVKQQELPALKQCGSYTLYGGEGNTKVLIPLTSVSITSELRGAFATTDVDMNFINPTSDSSYECTFTFPKDKTTILSKFTAMIEGREIETKI